MHYNSNSGISRLSLMQAEFQAKQNAEKESKLFQLFKGGSVNHRLNGNLEENAVTTVTSVNNNQRHSHRFPQTVVTRQSSNSANSGLSMSSNSSSSVYPNDTSYYGPLYRSASIMPEDVAWTENRTKNRSNCATKSPVGWDRSFPLKPVDRHSQINQNLTKSKTSPNLQMLEEDYNQIWHSRTGYGGNYGQRKRKDVSLDRGRSHVQVEARCRGTEDGRIARTRSHTTLAFRNSAGEESQSSVSSQSDNQHEHLRRRENHLAHFGGDDRACISRREEIKNNNFRRRDLSPNKNLFEITRTSRSNVSKHFNEEELSCQNYCYSSESKSEYPPVLRALKGSSQLPGNAGKKTEQNFSRHSKPRINSRTFRKHRTFSTTSNEDGYHTQRRNVEENDREDLYVNKNGGVVTDFTYDDDEYDDERVVNDKLPELSCNIKDTAKIKNILEKSSPSETESRQREEHLMTKIKEQQLEIEAIKQEKIQIEQELLLQRKLLSQDNTGKDSRSNVSKIKDNCYQIDNISKNVSPAVHLSRQNTQQYKKTVFDDVPNDQCPSPIYASNDIETKMRNVRLYDQHNPPSPHHHDMRKSHHVNTRRQQQQPSTTIITGSRNSNINRPPNSPRKEIKMESPRTQDCRRSNNVHKSRRRSIFASRSTEHQPTCETCGRSFASDRIEKHSEICAKTSSKRKRKVFDSTKKRVLGTDAEYFHKKSIQNQNSATNTNAVEKSDWRKKREEFIRALREAKAVQRHLSRGGKLSDLPPPVASDTSDYISCPYCNRRFNSSAAERHIPKCKDIKCNKKSSNSKYGASNCKQ